MAALPDARIAELLTPYVIGSLPEPLVPAVSRYLDLILQWNARTNLSAVREPEQIVQRQIGESLFCARLVPATGTLLDFGSGAGFPGIPLLLLRPDRRVTLAESQGKKASFLREAVRVLGLQAEIWSRRVEDLPVGTQFDVVTMRAVDKTDAMLAVAQGVLAPGGTLLRFLGEADDAVAVTGDLDMTSDVAVPLSRGRVATFKRP